MCVHIYIDGSILFSFTVCGDKCVYIISIIIIITIIVIVIIIIIIIEIIMIMNVYIYIYICIHTYIHKPINVD